MEHWGDPWADNNADEQRSPTKHAVTSPALITNTPAPALLNGFLDDAGWGNDDDAFGEWSTPTEPEVKASNIDASPTHAQLDSENHTESANVAVWGLDGTLDATAVSLKEDKEDIWSRDVAHHDGKIPSDTSDASTTTMQAHSKGGKLKDEITTRSHHDDDSSARPSTCASVVSPREINIESPRTSLDEDQSSSSRSQAEDRVEHNIRDDSVDSKDGPEAHGIQSEGQATSQESMGLGKSSKHDGAVEYASEPADASSEGCAGAREVSHAPQREPKSTSPRGDSLQIDASLLENLFSNPAPDKTLEDAPEDPIHSTEGRKAWYRLTRKQTLREYNSGNGDDNYIRVTWSNSHIRTEVHKIVGRWAREDRISGTGPGARASFYWDTPAPVDLPKTSIHNRTKTAVAAPRIVAPARQSLPPMATSTSAAFNWSSPSAALDPWKQNEPAHVAMPSQAVSNTPRSEFWSPDIEPKKVGVASHGSPVPETAGQSSVATLETPIVAAPPVQPISNATAPTLDPWAGLDTFERTEPVVPSNDAGASVADDDDEWGEMVTSPTIPTASGSDEVIFDVPSDGRKPLGPENSGTGTSAQEQAADTMHASPIVRLRSTISPTSAVFGAKTFVPLGVENGPIGPGLLKPLQKSVSIKNDNNEPAPVSFVGRMMGKPKDAIDKHVMAPKTNHTAHSIAALQPAEADDEASFVFASSTLPQNSLTPQRPSTPKSSQLATTNSGGDSWGDADFSIFESVAPKTQAAVTSERDPSDSFSVFETPPRPSSSTSSVKTFTRSPPRNMTPPTVQPLTGATNSAQRRKMEEEQVIKDILQGLPDMSYMLR